MGEDAEVDEGEVMLVTASDELVGLQPIIIKKFMRLKSGACAGYGHGAHAIMV